MRWYKVSIIKNAKEIMEKSTISDNKREAINKMKNIYPCYKEEDGYIYNAILEYDGCKEDYYEK